MAGAGGFEPPDAGTKNRCLTAWRRPNVPNSASRTLSPLPRAKQVAGGLLSHFGAVCNIVPRIDFSRLVTNAPDCAKTAGPFIKGAANVPLNYAIMHGETEMTKIAIGVYGLERWFGGDFASVIDVVRAADEAGIDQVSIPDHVVMGEHLENSPYGPFRDNLGAPWSEPVTSLAAFAGVTKTIRLSMGILIAPLRPAVLLAKQLATLDVLSRGRLDVGLGLGWQKEEYDAAGVPWEGRYLRMEEQVRVCRELWTKAPAAFHGKTVDFEKIHALPRPAQGRLPIWFGLAPTEKNFARIAELGDGWIPMENEPDKLAPMLDDLRNAFTAAGRDPGKIDVRIVAPYVFREDFTCDLDATLAKLPALIKAGVTVRELHPLSLCAA